MSQKRQIVVTRPFLAEITALLAKRSLLPEDYDALKRVLAENPEAGTLLTGTGGVRKIRLKSASKGKSGGFRVCYFYYMAHETVYLLFIFAKNEQENLTAEQKHCLKSITNELKRKT